MTIAAYNVCYYSFSALIRALAAAAFLASALMLRPVRPPEATPRRPDVPRPAPT